MDSTPKQVPDVVGTPEELVAKVQEAKDAMDLANAAEPVTITDDDGNEVTSLKVVLTPAETMRVMALPVDQRAAMAENILRERAAAKAIRKTVGKLEAAEKRESKKKRKAQAKARRRNR